MKLTRAINWVFAWLIIAASAAAGFFEVFTSFTAIDWSYIACNCCSHYFFTAKFEKLVPAAPPHWLVMMQSFRIAVECWLWYAFSKDLIPEQMRPHVAFVFHILSFRQVAVAEK